MLGQLDVHMHKMRNLNPYLTLYTEITSKWDLDINVKAKAESSRKKAQ